MTRREPEQAINARREPPADIELTASAKAMELEFRETPETEVRFSGSPGHESVSQDARRNLPETVQPGVTYRDVEIDYRLAARIADGGDNAAGPAERERVGDE